MSLPRIVAIVFFVCVIRLVSKGKLSLRYSFFWLSLSVVILIAAISSGFIGAIGDLFGSVLTTNFVFFLGLFLLLAFLPMLSVIATKQAANIKNLTQRLAIIEKEIVRDCCRRCSALVAGGMAALLKMGIAIGSAVVFFDAHRTVIV